MRLATSVAPRDGRALMAQRRFFGRACFNVPFLVLVACSPDAVDDVLRAFHADGFDRATVIGRIIPGEPRVVVDAGHAEAIAAHRQAHAA